MKVQNSMKSTIYKMINSIKESFIGFYDFITHKDTLEVRRQLLHLSLGLTLSFIIAIGAFDIFLFSCLLLCAIILSFISKKTNIPLITFLLEYFDRPKDIKEFPGKGFITFLIGTIVSVLVFDILLNSQVASLIAVLALTIGDSMSSIYGNLLGKIKNPLNKKKSLEGMIFGLAFLTIILHMFIPWTYAVIISGFVNMFEALELKIFGKVMDDNIYLPLLGGSIFLLLNLII